jgi:signal transduction histidine kinase/DNA-binding NarL/FixJ family response regulator/HAMP domain-containing protein
MKLKTKLISGIVIQNIVIIALSMLLVSYLIINQNIASSYDIIKKSFKVILDDIESRKKDLNGAINQMATMEGIGLKIKYITRYKTKIVPRLTRTTYRELAETVFNTGMIVQKVWKVFIYDLEGDLVSFTQLSNTGISFGYAEGFPLPTLHVNSIKTRLDEPNNWTVKKEITGINIRFRGNIPDREIIRFEQIDNYLCLVSYVPIMGLGYNQETDKMESTPMGFAVVIQRLDNIFVNHLSKLTDMKINVFTRIGLSVGDIPEYNNLDWNLFPQKMQNQGFSLDDLILNEINIDGKGYFQGLLPIYADNTLIGAIGSLYSKSIMWTNTYQMVEMLILVFLGCFILIVPISLLFSRSIIRPIAFLRDGMKQIQAGKLGRQVNIENKDEIGDLSLSFNQMSINLKDQEEELHRHRGHLEALVAERTETINQELAAREVAESRIAQWSDLQVKLLGSVDLNEKLRMITDGLVDIFGADFARIWMLGSGDTCSNDCAHADAIQNGQRICSDHSSCLHLKASSGRYTHLNGDHQRIPIGAFKIGKLIADKQNNFVTNDVVNDHRVVNQQWARDIGLVAFAGYGLFSLDSKPLGVLALFSKKLILAQEENYLQGVAAMTSQVIQVELTKETLVLAKQEAETATIAKSEFLANMSHEIRTPLNAVTGFSELLTSIVIDKKQKSYLNSIKTAGRSLLTLINDILDLSKIEAGRVEINLSPVNIYRLVSEIEQIFKIEVHERNLEFIIEWDQELPTTLILDETRVRQVLFNLVGNAVKFTKKGYIKLSVKMINDPDDTKVIDLAISIEDTGIGIKQTDQTKIFNSFEQQSNQDINKYGGTGLGLTITKRLVELMDGHVELKSTLSKGSTFTIHLNQVKIASSEAPVIVTESLKIDQISFESSMILIVDDIDSNRKLLKELLEKTKIKVVTAQNGQEAILMAIEFKPDLILMDIRMPVMNGIDATIELKKNPETKNIPVIALTASAALHDKEKMKEIGMEGYLTKPIRISQLLTELSRFLEYKRKEKKIEKQVDHSPEKINFLSVLVTVLRDEILPEVDNNLKGAISIKNIEEVKNHIKELGITHNVHSLVQCSEKLDEFVENFDVAGIKHALIELSDISNSFIRLHHN